MRISLTQDYRGFFAQKCHLHGHCSWIKQMPLFFCGRTSDTTTREEGKETLRPLILSFSFPSFAPERWEQWRKIDSQDENDISPQSALKSPPAKILSGCMIMIWATQKFSRHFPWFCSCEWCKKFLELFETNLVSIDQLADHPQLFQNYYNLETKTLVVVFNQ